MKSRFLKKIDIFSALDEEELRILSAHCRERNVDPGVLLFAEGDEGDELYIVISGRLGISVSLAGGGSIDITDFGPGEFFGEMSIFQEEPRSASCRAKAPSLLLSLKAADFFSMTESHPQTAIKIMHGMLNVTTNRLRTTNSFLTEMVRWGEDARRRAVTDEFTGLFNRGFFDSTLRHRVRDARTRGTPLSLAMVDLDGFGRLNARYGEELCNRIIRESAEAFRRVFTDEDILTRYGGDEFAFILPGKSTDAARRLCEAACKEIRTLNINANGQGSPVQITSSIGIASIPDHTLSAADLVKYADEALYHAKQAGRDRAACYEEGIQK